MKNRKETDLQKLAIDAVNERGGFAFKMSHRFLIGVADLFIKLPDHPVKLLEVKQTVLAPGSEHRFDPGLTVLQERFLKDARAAGVDVGILSFVQARGSNIRGVRVQLYSFPTSDLIWATDHQKLGDDDNERKDTLWNMLRA